MEFLRLLLNLSTREGHYWNLLEALLIFTILLLFKISVSSLHILLFILFDLHQALNLNILFGRSHINLDLTFLHFLHSFHPDHCTFVTSPLIPILQRCCPHILLLILQQDLDKEQIFPFQLLIHPRLILLSHTIDDLRYGVPVLLHLLMMTSALIGIPRDDHISHHIINLYALFLDWVQEEVMEVCEENRIFQSLFFVPMAVPLIF